MLTNDAKEIDMKNIFLAIRKRAFIIIIFTTICVLVGFIYSELKYPKPLYEVSSRIVIHDQSELKNTLIVFFKEPALLAKVKEDLQLQMEMEELHDRLIVEDINDSQILSVTFQHENYETAALIVNKIVHVYKELVSEILNFRGVEILSEAPLHKNEQSYNMTNYRTRFLLIGFIIGFISSIGFALLLDSIDDKIRSEREVERLLQIQVVGSVSSIKYKKRKKKNDLFKGENFNAETEKHSTIS